MMGEYTIRIADVEDLPHVLTVQREAFCRVALQLEISPETLPPLRETEEDLRLLLEGGTTFFVATLGLDVVGSVRGVPQEGVVSIGRLVVADAHLRKGIATRLMDALESHFTDAAAFELFTGVDAVVPLRLYEARGYREFRRELTPATELVWLIKTSR